MLPHVMLKINPQGVLLQYPGYLYNSIVCLKKHEIYFDSMPLENWYAKHINCDRMRYVSLVALLNVNCTYKIILTFYPRVNNAIYNKNHLKLFSCISSASFQRFIKFNMILIKLQNVGLPTYM